MGATSIPAKNSLNDKDARQLENAFQTKLNILQGSVDITVHQSAAETPINRIISFVNQQPSTKRFAAQAIDKSELFHFEPRRVRDKAHMRFVTKQPCLVCGRRPADPHHLRFAQHRALGRKVSDEFTVPLCRTHHRELHRQADEATWWMKLGIDPNSTADPSPSRHFGGVMPRTALKRSGFNRGIQCGGSSLAAG